MYKIKAAVLREKQSPLRIESLELEGPLDNEILVRIVSTGICHTDISCLDDWDRTSEPVILGHEGAGMVIEVGREVKNVDPGDHVILSYLSCGECRQCQNVQPWACQSFYEANFGFKRLDGSNALQRNGVRGHFFGQSSFATYSVVTERNIVKVPNDLDLEILCPLGCGIQTGAGTVMNSLAVPERSSIAIFGTGAVGLAAVMAARIVGARPIIGVDINPARLELALELGATHVIDNRQDDITSCISGITGGGVDFVLEITGNPEMLQSAISILNPHGTVALLTSGSVPDYLTEGRKALSIIQGNAVPQLFIPKLITLYQEGLFPFDRLEKFYEFNDINQAIADARCGNTIKPVLRVREK